jgi:hypothetical protein
VSVTQQFNTTTSMGRLTLNVLLSFAQFDREVIGERIRDKIAASKRKAGGGEMGVVCRFVTHPAVVPLQYNYMANFRRVRRFHRSLPRRRAIRSNRETPLRA